MTYGGGYGGGFAWPQLTSAIRTLIWINLVVFVLNLFVGGQLIWWLGVSAEGLIDGYGLGVLRLVTNIFVHSFTSPFHLLGNMLILYFFGTFVEGAATGRDGMFRLYFGAGIFGSLVFVLTQLVTGETGVPGVGASGAGYAIITYAAVLAPRMRVIVIVFPVELRWLVTFLLGIGFYALILDLAYGLNDGIAHGAHLGGAAYGFLAATQPRLRAFHSTPQEFLPPGRDGFFHVFASLQAWMGERKQRAARKSAERERRQAAEREKVLDALLEKVKTKGMDSLTDAERRFLQKASESMRR